MFINLDKNMSTFGGPDARWTDVNSDVLLAHQGAEPLDMGLAATFADYCQYHVAPFLNWANEAKEEDRLPRIERVLKEITPAKWNSYRSQYQKLLLSSNEVSVDSVAGEPRMGLTQADSDKVVARFLGV